MKFYTKILLCLTAFSSHLVEGAEESYRLAWAHYHGDGVQQSYKEAARLFRSAAENDHTMALYQLGVMHRYGRGVEKNIEKTIGYFKKSAEKGNAYVYCDLYWLGKRYRFGEGWPYKNIPNDIEKNLEKAKELFELVAQEKNLLGGWNNDAIIDLKEMYENGKG